jgi:hypothetical protein
MDMEKENAFEFLNFTNEEAVEALAEVEKKNARDGRICLCGHPNKRHEFIRDRAVCKAAKQLCPCSEIRLVLKVDNARPFLRKTTGGGPFHALSQGMATAHAAGIGMEWLVEMKCDVCREERRLSPVPVNEAGTELNGPSAYNALVCDECRREM